MPSAREIENFNQEAQEKWNHFMKVRADVLKSLEEARSKKVIGNPLEAKITVEAKDDYTKQVLESIPNVHQLLIVSEANVNEAHEKAKDYKHVRIFVEKHPGEKCERCWMLSNTVGENEKHPEICTRCADVVEEHYSHLV